MNITLAVTSPTASYRVTFTGPQAEDHALAFIFSRPGGYSFAEVEGAYLDLEYFPGLAEVLYPISKNEWLYATDVHPLVHIF